MKPQIEPTPDIFPSHGKLAVVERPLEILLKQIVLRKEARRLAGGCLRLLRDLFQKGFSVCAHLCGQRLIKNEVGSPADAALPKPRFHALFIPCPALLFIRLPNKSDAVHIRHLIHRQHIARLCQCFHLRHVLTEDPLLRKSPRPAGIAHIQGRQQIASLLPFLCIALRQLFVRRSDVAMLGVFAQKVHGAAASLRRFV